VYKAVPFKAAHLGLLDLQDAQDYLSGMKLTYQQAKAIENVGMVYSGFYGDQILISGGIIKQWEGRYLGWALVSKEAKNHMLKITKFAQWWFDELQARTPDMIRLEANVDKDFSQGQKWVKLLGFIPEHGTIENSTMEAYGLNGRDVVMYKRIRK